MKNAKNSNEKFEVVESPRQLIFRSVLITLSETFLVSVNTRAD